MNASHWSAIIALIALGVVVVINGIIGLVEMSIPWGANLALIGVLNYAVHRDGCATGEEEAVRADELAAYRRGVESEKEAESWRRREAAQKAATTRKAKKLARRPRDS